MNTQISKVLLIVFLSAILGASAGAAVGTFTFRTSGASDTTEVVDLRYPQKVPEDASVTTDSIADDSITNDKLAEPISVANGGTGKTTAAEALAALGGASLNGSSTVGFAARSYALPIVGAYSYVEIATSVASLATNTTAIFNICGDIGVSSERAPTGFVIVGVPDGPYLDEVTVSGNVTALLRASSSVVSATKDTANRVNVYFEGGKLVVQNKLAFNAANLFVIFRGVRRN